jgi:uncharacterized membrane protein YGL010W
VRRNGSLLELLLPVTKYFQLFYVRLQVTKGILQSPFMGWGSTNLPAVACRLFDPGLFAEFSFPFPPVLLISVPLVFY